MPRGGVLGRKTHYRLRAAVGCERAPHGVSTLVDSVLQAAQTEQATVRRSVLSAA